MTPQPATAADLDALLALQKSPIGLCAYTHLLRQVEIGPAWVVRAGDRPVALGGVLSAEGWKDEAWLVAGPDARARLVSLARAIRRVLRDRASVSPVGIVARVMVDNGSGERLARVLGFVPTGLAYEIEPRGQIWNYGEHACSPTSAPASSDPSTERYFIPWSAPSSAVSRSATF